MPSNLDLSCDFEQITEFAAAPIDAALLIPMIEAAFSSGHDFDGPDEFDLAVDGDHMVAPTALCHERNGALCEPYRPCFVMAELADGERVFWTVDVNESLLTYVLRVLEIEVQLAPAHQAG